MSFYLLFKNLTHPLASAMLVPSFGWGLGEAFTFSQFLPDFSLSFPEV